MQTGTCEKLKGDVEADETGIGGRSRFMHASRNKRCGNGTGYTGKAMVMGLLQRNGLVIAKHVLSNRKHVLQVEVRAHVDPGSNLYTDYLKSYTFLRRDYAHEFIDHAGAYVRGNVHTNGLENFWSLLKRTLKGTYISVDPVHLFRYLDEQVFRFNSRKTDESARFVMVATPIFGKRLTYEELIGNAQPA